MMASVAAGGCFTLRIRNYKTLDRALIRPFSTVNWVIQVGSVHTRLRHHYRKTLSQ